MTRKKSKATGRAIVYGGIAIMCGTLTMVTNNIVGVNGALVLGGVSGGILSLILGLDVFYNGEDDNGTCPKKRKVYDNNGHEVY